GGDVVELVARLGQRPRQPPERGAVRGGQLGGQERQRGAVGDRRVESEQQAVLARRLAEQRGAEERTAREVERLFAQGGGEARDLRGAQPGRKGREVDRRDRRRDLRREPGVRRGAVLRERRVQHLLPADDFRERLAERRRVERARQAERHLQAARRAVARGPQPPQLLLAPRERQGADAHGRCRLRHALGDENVGDRSHSSSAISSSLRLSTRAMIASSTASAISASVGLSNTVRSGSSTSKVPRIFDISWVASSEWPPISKKLSNAPTRRTERSACQISASTSSASLRGAT